MGIATRLRLARLLLITDLRSGDLAEFVAATASAGVDVLQLRDPKAGPQALADGFATARANLSNRDALLGLYDTVELAHEAKADLLQLSERGRRPPRRGRRCTPGRCWDEAATRVARWTRRWPTPR